MNKIFQRTYSTKGSGLGLNIVQDIINNLGYELEVKSGSKETKWIIKII